MIISIYGGASRTPHPTAEHRPTSALISIVVSTIKRLTNKKCGLNLWQKSFHDHIIRNEIEYNEIWKYIDENPIKWELDRYYNK